MAVRKGNGGAVDGRLPPYERIKQAIVSGEFGPGSALVETTLAAWCEVSRTPIREALLRLEQDGLVDRNDRGLVVRERSPEQILDIYETRIALEATAGRLAADRRTDHDLRLLRRLLALGEQTPAADAAAMVEVNRGFHRAVWRASHNESLIDLLDRLELHLARYPGTTLAVPGRWKAARHQHELLVEAIAARDATAAHELARVHFHEARDIRLDLFETETPLD
jgi:DNA-binding GntR family transcriptional regulator